MISVTSDSRLATFSRFLLTGGLATAIQFLLLWLFVDIAKWNPTFSSGLSFALSACVNYTLSYYFTFAAKVSHRTATLKFVIMVCIGLLLNTSFFHMFNYLLSGQYLLAQMVSTLLVILWNFNISSKWIFNKT